MQIRERILKKATELYCSHGITTVSSDEIARSLGISKATIYKHFKNKELIVSMVIEAEIAGHLKNIALIKGREDDAILLISKIWDYLEKTKLTTSPNFFRDIERYYGQLWKQVTNFEKDLQKWVFLPVIRAGMSAGHFRSDTDELFASRHWLELHHFGPYQPAQSQALKRHFIRGILSEKGYQTYRRIFPASQFTRLMGDSEADQTR